MFTDTGRSTNNPVRHAGFSRAAPGVRFSCSAMPLTGVPGDLGSTAGTKSRGNRQFFGSFGFHNQAENCLIR